jgi:plasmid maintenance system antidote protein VapI
MTRDEALVKLTEKPYDEETMQQDMEYVAKKLGITKNEFIALIQGENKIYKDYRNSLKIIEFSIKLAKKFGIEKRNFR